MSLTEKPLVLELSTLGKKSSLKVPFYIE